MQRRQLLKTTGIIAAGSLTALSGCSGTNPDEGEGTTSGANGDSNTVEMVTEGSDYYFDPIGLFIESGETVTFVNESGSHSATAYEDGNGQATVTRIPDDAEAWDSSILGDEGATFEHTFETSGTYDYFCSPHKSQGMVGRIIVDEPGGPADGNMPPDGDVPEGQTIVDQGSVAYSDFTG